VTGRAADPLREKVEALPRGPGVYLLRDERGRVAYVGKAVDLRARVRSYLRPEGDGRAAVAALVQRIADVDFILTGNEKEALLLENTLIKRHRPRYNVRLRDDKAYLCIRLDVAHRWPRIHMVRRFHRDGALYFGPFSNAKAVRRTIRTLGAIFPLRLCSDRVLASRKRPCLYHQLKRCCAPCVGLVTEEEYRPMVEGMVTLLRGRSEEVVRRLREEMAQAAEALEFERAGAVRDRLQALESTTLAQRVQTADLRDRDVLGIARRGEVAVAALLHIREGRLLSKRSFSLRTILPDGAVLRRVLQAAYGEGRLIPPEILLPCEPEEAEELRGAFAERRGGAVALLTPQRGAGRELLLLATRNAEEEAGLAQGDAEKRAELLEALRRRLGLPRTPHRIECYDISTIQGSETVGSRVVFQDGLPDTDGYRRFRVRTVGGQDDFASMREVLTRRFRSEEPPPDLVVIDGGPAQLSEARKGMPEEVSAVGLAKERTGPDGARKPERIYAPGSAVPMPLPPDAPETYLLARIRDEAHRFAIAYHRKLRSRRAIRSVLDGIPGLGPKRRTALLRAFGSASGVRAATEEQLRAAGMPAPLVAAIRAWAGEPS